MTRIPQINQIKIKVSTLNNTRLRNKIQQNATNTLQKAGNDLKSEVNTSKAYFAALLATSASIINNTGNGDSSKTFTLNHKHQNQELTKSDILAQEDKSFIYSGFDKNKISFDDTNTDLGVELNEDYFKLPQNAKPDKYQIAAAQNLHAGKTTIVSAPTGTGKTAIANYIISKNLAEGERTFYLTPLKALSNDKLNEFRAKYGAENVGILTGDRKENANAPIVIMTTEVYCNMIANDYFKNKNNPQNIIKNDNAPKTVIYDEIHYISDPDRGLAWEISMMCTPKTTQILGLSATVGNDTKLTNWISRINAQKPTLIHVPTKARHVPIIYENYDIFTNKINEFISNDDEYLKTHEKKHGNSYEKKLMVNDYLKLINKLNENKKTPTILYVLSKNFSKKIVQAVNDSEIDLTNKEEKKQIKEIYYAHKVKNKYLGQDIDLSSLSKGIAVHNSGILPVAKELVEELFRKKLLKVVLATETLAAGINMPARSCVMTTAEKPCSDPEAKNGKREFTPNEFAQATGRAGRRGFDDVGYCILVPQNTNSEIIFNKLVNSSPNDLISRFTIDYSQICSYHKRFSDTNIMKEFIANSFKFYQEKEKNPNYKVDGFIKIYEKKCKLLENDGFLNSISATNKKLTPKGELLHNIIGYQQIPLLNTISSKQLQKLTPEELVFFAATIVSGQYNNFKDDEEREFVWEKPSTIIKRNIEALTPDNYNSISSKNLDETINTYNEFNEQYKCNLEKYKIYDTVHEKINLDFAGLVHSFVYQNSQKENQSVANWQNTLTLLPENGLIKDEGSLYNAVNQTADLISQMIDLCNSASKMPELQDSQQYYRILAAKLKTAMLLLKQAPIEDYKYEH